MKRTFRRGHRRRKTQRASRPKALLKQRGSGMEEMRAMMVSLATHEYLRQIGPFKPVATPNSNARMANMETDFSRHIRLWRDLTPEDKNIMNERLLRHKKFSLDAFIAEDHIHNPAIIANPIIFYAKEYLDILALASERTTEEILMIIATISKKTPEEMDIIHIAFGDEYLYDRRLSAWGERVKATYLALVSEIADVSKVPKLPY